MVVGVGTKQGVKRNKYMSYQDELNELRLYHASAAVRMLAVKEGTVQKFKAFRRSGVNPTPHRPPRTHLPLSLSFSLSYTFPHPYTDRHTHLQFSLDTVRLCISSLYCLIGCKPTSEQPHSQGHHPCSFADNLISLLPLLVLLLS